MSTEHNGFPPPTKPTRIQRIELFVLGLLLIVMGAIMVFAWTPGAESLWIDPVTGSTKTETRWFGRTTASDVQQSAIEKWMIEHGAVYPNRWQRVSTQRMTIFGGTVSVTSSANAPPIFSLCSGSLDQLFVLNSTDQEKTDFVHAMTAGTESERQQAVDAATKKAVSTPRSE